MEITGKWSNAVGTDVVHFFPNPFATFRGSMCNYRLDPREGEVGRRCKRCEKGIASENKRRQKDIAERAEIIEKISNMSNTVALDRFIDLSYDKNSEWGNYSNADSVECEELEKNIRYRLTYYGHGEE